jgi:hypothetical protein
VTGRSPVSCRAGAARLAACSLSSTIPVERRRARQTNRSWNRMHHVASRRVAECSTGSASQGELPMKIRSVLLSAIVALLVLAGGYCSAENRTGQLAFRFDASHEC